MSACAALPCLACLDLAATPCRRDLQVCVQFLRSGKTVRRTLPVESIIKPNTSQCLQLLALACKGVCEICIQLFFQQIDS